MITYSGLTDEAADGIGSQISATRELGWRHIEARNVNKRNLHDLSDREFDGVAGALDSAGIRVHCLGSAIGSWSKPVEAPFDSSLEEVRRAIPRMKRLGTHYIRIMSFGILPNRSAENQMFDERVKRLRVIVRMFADEGITALHENCANYGGMGWPFTLRLLESVPGLRLILDTANPATMLDRSRESESPIPLQSSWEFYEHVKPYVDHVHIKDGVLLRMRTDAPFHDVRYTWPGEGDGDVRRIVRDLLISGYAGAFSIEPHLETIYHEPDPAARERARYRTYVEYGRRFMQMVESIQEEADERCRSSNAALSQ